MTDPDKAAIERFLTLHQEIQALELRLSDLNREKDDLEEKIIENLNDDGAERSKSYEGIGFVTMEKPAVRKAWINPGCEESFFCFLRDIGREELIKTTVHNSSLRALINDRVKNNESVPQGVGYIVKERLRAYPEKK